MTAGNQIQTAYSYDNADRLTQITQGNSTVSFGYDNANRRTSVTLPNGIVMSYSYDGASHVDVWFSSTQQALNWGLKRNVPVEVCDDGH
jgi:YD repeat-containing protein